MATASEALRRVQTICITDPFILQEIMEAERAGAIEKPPATIGMMRNKKVRSTSCMPIS
jgi:hypothetical protein